MPPCWSFCKQGRSSDWRRVAQVDFSCRGISCLERNGSHLFITSRNSVHNVVQIVTVPSIANYANNVFLISYSNVSSNIFPLFFFKYLKYKIVNTDYFCRYKHFLQRSKCLGANSLFQTCCFFDQLTTAILFLFASASN